MIPFDLEYLERFQNIAIIFYSLKYLDAIFHSEVLVQLYVVLFFDTVFGMLVVIDQSGIISQEQQSMRIFVQSSDIIIIFEFGRQDIINSLVVRVGFGSYVPLRLIEENNLRLLLSILNNIRKLEVWRFYLQCITLLHLLRIGFYVFSINGNIAFFYELNEGSAGNLMMGLDIGS